MTFEGLVEWVGDALLALRDERSERELRHVETLYAMLGADGASSADWLEWQKLAVKCAALLETDPPEPPSAETLKAARKERRRAARGATKAKEPRRKAAPKAARRSSGLTDARSDFTRRHDKRVAARPRPSRQRFEVSDEFRVGVDSVRNGSPLVFVTGRAGTGKSTFIRYLQDELASKNVAVVAPTGIAALNAGGQTIHSFFRFPPRTLSDEDVRELDDPSVITHLDVLVVDEVSMVRADVMDAIDLSLRRHRKNQDPFGGVQLVLVGDLFQLPPIIRNEDQDVLAGRYTTPFFFGAAALRGVKAVAIELTRVHRQEDPRFIEILGRLRDGRDLAAAVKELNESARLGRPSGPHLMLVTRNADADRENASRLAALDARPRTYAGELDGEFGDDRLPAPRELTLKPGARVMFTRNDAERRWVNGTTGTVLSLRAESVEVRLDAGETYDVAPEMWENKRYLFEASTGKVEPVTIGSYTQVPLMPAWAVTIHKAQGLTLDKVHVDFGRGAFADGQAYVALSRCRRIEDVTLERPLRISDVRSSDEIRRFYRRMRGNAPAVAMRVAACDLRGASDLEGAFRYLAEIGADVVVISSDRSMRQELTAGGFTHVFESGVLTVASRPEAVLSAPEPRNGALLAVDVGAITILAAAFPGGADKRAAWDALERFAEDDRPVLLTGNLNSGRHEIDEEGATMLCAGEFERFAARWTDLWRASHGEMREYTWSSPRGRRFRIDHAFASPALADRVRECSYVHEPREQGLAQHSVTLIDIGA